MTSPADPSGPEHAAQLERTALAWQRTALVLAVDGVLLVRSHDLGPVGTLAGAGVVAVALLVWAAAGRGYHVRRGSRAGALLAGYRGANTALTTVAVALSVAATGALLVAG